MLPTDIIVKNGQTIPDLAVQENGTLEGIFELAAASGKGITDLLSAGEVLAAGGLQDRKVKAYYAENKLKPASESGAGTGIGYYAIGVDFTIA